MPAHDISSHTISNFEQDTAINIQDSMPLLCAGHMLAVPHYAQIDMH